VFVVFFEVSVRRLILRKLQVCVRLDFNRLQTCYHLGALLQALVFPQVWTTTNVSMDKLEVC
jgi:hypothetical protein